MKERPILFSGEMVRAILDGRKTQTRRVMKCPVSCHSKILGQPMEHEPMVSHKGDWHKPNEWSPYGIPGDRLWVRETWQALNVHRDIPMKQVTPQPPICCLAFKATEQDRKKERLPVYSGKWRPSIFMPRWASRILLEITNVRVERVQEINEADALAEGVGFWGCDTIEVFQNLWDSINAKRGYSWESNPWVWVIEFKRVKEQK